MFGHRPRVKCFNAAYHTGSYVSRADLGYQVVPVAKIVGSVGRCDELDEQFQPLRPNRARRHRLENIRRLVNRGETLPPVELYKLKDEYYVVDGNHRVAVAKENDQTYIDAYVIEFLPEGESADDRLYLERRAFIAQTGLDHIRTNRLGGYDRLLAEIREHARQSGSEPRPIRQAADDWYRRVFRPVVRTFEVHRLLERMPGRTTADLYLDLQALRAYFSEQEGRELSWQEVIRDLVAMHPLPSWSERLVAAWEDLAERLRAWWHGLRASDLPCSFALQSPSGTIYCRRVGRMKREGTQT